MSVEAIRITTPGKSVTTVEGPIESVLFEKRCKHCNVKFETDDPRKEYCRPSHGDMYNRKMRKV